MPHKRAKAVGKLLFFDNKTTPRSIDRFGFNPNNISRDTVLCFLLYESYDLLPLPAINPNRSLDRICLDLLLPSCFLTALVHLPASAPPFHLAVARYTFDETSIHLLNNRTKSVKESNDRFGIKVLVLNLHHIISAEIVWFLFVFCIIL